MSVLTSLIAATVAIFAGFLSNEYTICSTNSKIYTVDPDRPQVECISIKDSRISFTGSINQLAWWKTVSYVDENAIIVPGLADSHAHILDNGFKMQLDLDGCKSIPEVLDRLKAYINSNPDIRDDPTRWVEGIGWDQTKWPEKQFPTAKDLDADPLLRGRSIALRRVDVHAMWVSERVLQLMGDLPESVDGGLIIRNGNGNPTGIFVDNAMSLVPVPEWTEERMMSFFNATMNAALSFGLTSIHDADSSPKIIEFMQKLADQGKIPMHLYLMGNVESEEYWGSHIPRLIDYGVHKRLTVRSVKLFTDGALGSWGAALLEPYSDKPDTKGIMRTTPKALSNLVEQFWEDGWQVNIHCIGDHANHVVLDIFENLLIKGKNTTTNGLVKANATEWRPRIEHAQIMTMDDLVRSGRLGVIASVQPTHATSDMWYAETRLGPQRIKGAYAYQTLLKESPNHILPLGSDFPVEGVNPLLGFYAATSRLSAVTGDSPHGPSGWYPSESLSRAQALKGMTLDAAYASFSEHQRGSLTPGKNADFVILDKDIMHVSYEEILRTRVLATVIDGEVVYGSL